MTKEIPARVTLKYLAAQAGVSTSTASRALANNPAIASSTRERVQKLAAELGYRPNAQARALRSSHSNTIGVMVPDLINHYFALMVTAVQLAAAKEGISTIITTTGEDAHMAAESVRVLAEQNVDGIVCVPLAGLAKEIDGLANAGMPIVLIDRELSNTTIPTITSDPYPGMSAAMQLLCDIAAVPIGYLSGPMQTSTGRDRLTTFQRCCAEFGLEDQPVFNGGYKQAQGLIGAETLLDQGVKALFAGDSMMTIGVIEACHKRQLAIGKDIAVVGFDTHPVFELQPCPITVIDQHVEEMAVQAFDALLGLIRGHPPEQQHAYTPTTLIARQSTTLTPGGER